MTAFSQNITMYIQKILQAINIQYYQNSCLCVNVCIKIGGRYVWNVHNTKTCHNNKNKQQQQLTILITDQ